jgi:hypothetical protein
MPLEYGQIVLAPVPDGHGHIRVMGIVPGPQMIMIAEALRSLAERDDEGPEAVRD